MIHKCYKVTGMGGNPCHGGQGKWIPGEWREESGTEPCSPGMLHLCKDARQLLEWLHAEIWEAEYDDAKLVIDHGDKLAVQRARTVRKIEAWNERTARIFACDCAESVLSLYEKEHPGDKRPRQAIDTARRFADGKATKKELTATRAAARNAAEAVEAAAWAAEDAAMDAARRAAWAAAWAGAWDAAWAAARDAAWAAVDAAWAAKDAAWDSAMAEQASRLAALLGIGVTE